MNGFIPAQKTNKLPSEIFLDEPVQPLQSQSITLDDLAEAAERPAAVGLELSLSPRAPARSQPTLDDLAEPIATSLITGDDKLIGDYNQEVRLLNKVNELEDLKNYKSPEKWLPSVSEGRKAYLKELAISAASGDDVSGAPATTALEKGALKTILKTSQKQKRVESKLLTLDQLSAESAKAEAPVGFIEQTKKNIDWLFKPQRTAEDLNSAVLRQSDKKLYDLIKNPETKSALRAQDESAINEYTKEQEEELRPRTIGGVVAQTLGSVVKYGAQLGAAELLMNAALLAAGGPAGLGAKAAVTPALRAAPTIAKTVTSAVTKTLGAAGFVVATDPDYTRRQKEYKFEVERDSSGGITGVKINDSGSDGMAAIGRGFAQAALELGAMSAGGPLSRSVSSKAYSRIGQLLEIITPQSVKTSVEKIYMPKTPAYIREVFKQMRVFDPASGMGQAFAIDLGNTVWNFSREQAGSEERFEELVGRWTDPINLTGTLIGMSILPMAGVGIGAARKNYSKIKFDNMAKSKAETENIRNIAKQYEESFVADGMNSQAANVAVRTRQLASETRPVPAAQQARSLAESIGRMAARDDIVEVPIGTADKILAEVSEKSPPKTRLAVDLYNEYLRLDGDKQNANSMLQSMLGIKEVREVSPEKLSLSIKEFREPELRAVTVPKKAAEELSMIDKVEAARIKIAEERKLENRRRQDDAANLDAGTSAITSEAKRIASEWWQIATKAENNLAAVSVAKGALVKMAQDFVSHGVEYTKRDGSIGTARLPTKYSRQVVGLFKKIETSEDLTAAAKKMEEIGEKASRALYGKELQRINRRFYNKSSTGVDKPTMAGVVELTGDIYQRKLSEESYKKMSNLELDFQSGKFGETDVRYKKLQVLKKRAADEQVKKYVGDVDVDTLKSRYYEARKLEISAGEVFKKKKLAEAREVDAAMDLAKTINKWSGERELVYNILKKKPLSYQAKKWWQTVRQGFYRAGMGTKQLDLLANALDDFPVAKDSGAAHALLVGGSEAGHNTFLKKTQELDFRLDELRKKIKFTDDDVRMVGANGAIAQGPDGIQKLINSGLTTSQIEAAKKLTPTQQALRDFIRKVYDEDYVRVNKASMEMFDQPVRRVENYMQFASDSERMQGQVYPGMEYDAVGNKLKPAFLESRQGAGDQIINVNAIEVLRQYHRQAEHMINEMPHWVQMRKVLGDKSVINAIGPEKAAIINDYVDYALRGYKPAAGATIKWLDTIRKNVVVSALAFAKSVILSQPTSIINAFAYVGPGYVREASWLLMTDKNARKLVREMPQVADRMSLAPETRELAPKEKFQRAAMWLETKLDQGSAGIVALAAYLKYCHENNLRDIFNVNSAPNKAAIDYAQRLMRRTQASTDARYMPAWMTRTGNVSLMRAAFSMQNYAWNVASNMAEAAHYLRKDPKGAMITLSVFYASTLASSLIRDTLKTMRNAYAGKYEDEEDLDMGERVAGLLSGGLIDITRGIPLINNIYTADNYGKTGTWLADTVLYDIPRAVKTIGKALFSDEGVDPEKTSKAMVSGLYIGARLAGIPIPIEQADMNAIIKANSDWFFSD